MTGLAFVEGFLLGLWLVLIAGLVWRIGRDAIELWREWRR